MQVEKAFREGTARQNAHSIFVCLALKLLEERIHVACKEIVTLEKQVLVVIILVLEVLLVRLLCHFQFSEAYSKSSIICADETSGGRREGKT